MLFDDGVDNVNDAHEKLLSIVTVWVAAIITLSLTPGTTPPTQVAVLLQLPDIEEVIVAAKDFNENKFVLNTNTKRKKLK